ncbi:hypothetical protein M405DRAFT_844820 [Rhizopogon salebrosus TDB-379]|nr:hypothetical protein M405DRAFT_844820 [Rhizopogon salebrosus TDB-379]
MTIIDGTRGSCILDLVLQESISYYAAWHTLLLIGQKLDTTYWSSRAARVAASQIPLVTALGTKNNTVSLVTGISYDRVWLITSIIFHEGLTRRAKLNYIHRMTARMCFVLLCIHGASEASSPFFRLSLNESWLRLGVIAMIAFTTLFIVSLRAIRTKAYEHIPGGVILPHLGPTIKGTIDADQSVTDSLPSSASFWIWPSFIIWGFDRFIRMSGSGTMDATTELLSDDFVRETQFLGSSAPLWKESVFLINVHEGFTKKLKDVAAGNDPVKVFVDSPYSPSPDLGCYDTSVLVAEFMIGFSLPAHVQWIEEALFKAVQLVPPSLTVSIRIFVTGAAKAQINLSSEDILALSTSLEKNNAPAHSVAEADPSPSLLGGVELNNGRPNLDALLKEEISITSGRMSVSVCGSQGIARAVRHALRFPVSGPSTMFCGGPGVTLHVESFGYA